MAQPVINAVINFSTGPGFAQAMILDVGILGTNALADSTAVIVDVSSQVDRVEIARGRNAQSDQFQTGTLTLRIVDQNGNFNPMNTSGPYYGLLDPMRKVTISGTSAGITYPMFSGYITGYSTTTPLNAVDVVYTTITAVDAFRLANMAQISTVSGASAGDLAGTRVNQILDAIEWPNSMRDIDAGRTTLQADPGTARTSLAALQTVELSEYGALYIDATGSFVFQDRSVTAGSVTGTPTVFNEDGTGIRYSNALWILNDVLVYNSAQVSRSGGSVQTATNADSIALYFLHSYNQQNLLMQTDATALDYARAYVASRAFTSIRCDAITLDLNTENYAAGIAAALGLDYFDQVSITTTQPGNSSLSKTLQIFGVAHTVTPNSWRTTFTTLEPIIDAFILDDPVWGVLDSNVLSY